MTDNASEGEVLRKIVRGDEVDEIHEAVMAIVRDKRARFLERAVREDIISEEQAGQLALLHEEVDAER